VCGSNTVAKDSPLVAVTRNDRHRELFWVTLAGGVGAGYSGDKDDLAAFNHYQVAPPGCASSGPYSLAARATALWMGVWWIGINGTILGKHLIESWQPEPMLIAPERSSAVPGSLSVITRQLASQDCPYELNWIRPEQTIGSALTLNRDGGVPQKWSVSTVATQSLAMLNNPIVTINCNTEDVLACFAAETTGSVWCGIAFEPGTGRGAAWANKIRRGPGFESQLQTSTQDYHQVIAISQANINATLKYHFSPGRNTQLLTFKAQDIEGDDWTAKMDGELGPPTIELLDRTAEGVTGVDAALFFLHFRSGTFTYPIKVLQPDGRRKLEERTKDIAGWSLAFSISFGEKHIADLPTDIRNQVENPGSYSATQLLIDFQTANMAQFKWENCTIPGMDLSPGKGTEMKGPIELFVSKYLEILKKPGRHNIIGHALKLKPKSLVPAEFAPTSVKLQTMDYKPLQHEKLSPEAQKDRSAFCFTEMTGGVSMPTGDLQWTGNWFSGTIQGALLLRKSLFFEKFLLEQIKFINHYTLELLNQAFYFVSEPERANFPWLLDERRVKDPSTLSWILTSDGAVYKWNNTHDGKKGNVNYKWIHSELENRVTWHAGSGWISIESTMAVAETQENMSVGSVIFAILSQDSRGRVYDKSQKSAHIKWVTNIQLATVENAGLSVSVHQTMPYVTTEIDEKATTLFAKLGHLFNSPEARNRTLAQQIRKSLNEKFQDTMIQQKLEEQLNKTRQFVFPGGGTFEMKDPTFNNSGDLLLGLTYIQNNGTNAIMTEPFGNEEKEIIDGTSLK